MQTAVTPAPVRAMPNNCAGVSAEERINLVHVCQRSESVVPASGLIALCQLIHTPLLRIIQMRIADPQQP